jgi:xylulose-5-phosphate/fructose-6-phosphate phosphoketolase
MGTNIESIEKRTRFCDYLAVAQIFLQDNFLLDRPLVAEDIKPRLLGHWGTCPGINIAYANLKEYRPDMEFIVGPGHGYPALQANLYYDGELVKYYEQATRDYDGLAFVCREFSWPYGFPSHSAPMAPGVIAEGGELGYALGTAYGAALGQPEKFVVCLMGDGEMETGTTLASLNLNKLLRSEHHGTVLPILHLNGYKISGPTVYGRMSERELKNLVRGFGFNPVMVNGENTEEFQEALLELPERAFILMKTEKGATGPKELDGLKLAGNYASHQVPLPLARTNQEQLGMLEDWLKSYGFKELYDNFAR